MATKKYKGTYYDTKTDYSKLMQEDLAIGDYTSLNKHEGQRNAKIADQGLNYAQTHEYDQYNPAVRYTYDPSTNADYTKYQKQADKAYNKVASATGYDPTKNAEYTQYQGQMSDLFNRFMNQKKFSYDPQSDPLYQQYAQQYTTLGRQAMIDTQAQAAGLTGGYGNTYAQGVGQQAYQNYLMRLNDVIPELYSLAYNQYRDDQNLLQNQYQMARDASDTQWDRGYQLYSDQYDRNMDAYQLARDMADTSYDRGYNNWSTRLQYEKADEDTAWERRMYNDETAYSHQQDARANVLAIIDRGGTPSKAELAAAGMTLNDAKEMLQYVRASFKSGSGGSGSGGGGRGRSGRSYRGGSGGSGYSPASEASTNTNQKIVDSFANTLEQSQKERETGYWTQLGGYANSGRSKSDLLAMVKGWENSGQISSEVAARMIYTYGLDKIEADQGDTYRKDLYLRGGQNKLTKHTN